MLEALVTETENEKEIKGMQIPKEKGDYSSHRSDILHKGRKVPPVNFQKQSAMKTQSQDTNKFTELSSQPIHQQQAQ